MERPIDLDKRLQILILRTSGLTQDEVLSILHCGKLTVVDSERWFKGLPYTEAERLCNDTDIKRVVRKESITKSDELTTDLLVKAAQVTVDDILRRFREDYLLETSEHNSAALAIERMKQNHWVDLADVARKLASNLRFAKMYVIEQDEKIGEIVIGKNLEDRIQEYDPFLGQCLFSHMQNEISQLKDLTAWSQLKVKDITDELLDKLKIASLRKIFSGQCSVCSYQ
ncbi:hypothetical protein ACFLWV_00540 [Chloroflexota bacterium]